MYVYIYNYIDIDEQFLSIIRMIHTMISPIYWNSSKASQATAGDREQVPKARHAASTTRRRNMVAAIRSVLEWGAARQFWPEIWGDF